MASLPAGLAACASGPPAAPGAPPAGSPWPDRPFVLLGEVHDNAEHHRLRAQGLVAAVSAWQHSEGDGCVTVAFEPLARKRDAALRQALHDLGLGGDGGCAGPPRAARGWSEIELEAAAERIAQAAGLDRRGWGWPLHRPLVMACLQSGARIVGANLEPEVARDIARRGEAALPEDIRQALGADTGWGPVEQRAAEGDIDQGHCGLLPPQRWPAMALAQRARDAAMALSLLKARDGGARRVLLVAGNGHVRRDLGVPRYLTALGARARDIQSVGYLEANAPSAEWPSARRFDQVIYTAPSPRPDPCKGLVGRL